MKEIGILEYHYHSIFFYAIARICKTKQTNVTLFTTKEIFSLIENHLKHKEQYKIILKKDNESISSFLKRVELICNEKIDILFVNTIQESCKDLPHYFRFKPNCKMILTVHDANTWLNQKLRINLFKPFATLDTFISSFFINRYILKKFDAINVIYPPIKDYILDNTSYNKPIFTLPFTFFDNSKIIKDKIEDTTIKFVIPGAIVQTRRDHDVVLDAFENLFKKYQSKISLCLLGSPSGAYGQRIIKRCKKMKGKHYNVAIFEDYVPEKIYDKTLRKCNIIIIPIKLESRSLGIIQETFGLTKSSGVVFDAIQYAKPMVVPSKLNIIKELKSSTLKYEHSKDLENTLSEFIEKEDKLEELIKNAYENSKYFSLKVLQNYFIKDVLGDLKNN